MKDFEVYSWKERFGLDTFDVKIDGQKVAEDVPMERVQELWSDYVDDRSS